MPCGRRYPESQLFLPHTKARSKPTPSQMDFVGLPLNDDRISSKRQQNSEGYSMDSVDYYLLDTTHLRVELRALSPEDSLHQSRLEDEVSEPALDKMACPQSLHTDPQN